MRKVGPMLEKINRHTHSLDSIIFLAIVAIVVKSTIFQEKKESINPEWNIYGIELKHCRELNDILRFSEPCFARWCNLKPIFSSLAKGKCI